MRKKIALFTALLLTTLQARADDARLEKIQSIIEGVYTITEWFDGKQSLGADQFTARTVLQQGQLVWVANSSSEGKSLNYAGIGAYRITPTTFSYGYEKLITSVTTADGDKIDRNLPGWAQDMGLPAMREFALELKGDQVILTNKGARWDMTADGFTYTDLNTKNVRVWKKLKDPAR